MRDELGEDVEVETHIEPLETRGLEGRDVPSELTAAIAAELARHAAAGGVVGDVHDVRVRNTDAGLVVNYHCRVDPALSVTRVYDAVDVIDRRVKAGRSDICRVVGHAEPTRTA